MKFKLLILAVAFLGTTALAETKSAVPTLTKETLLNELKEGCLKSGNEKKACDCSISSFDKKVTKDEWTLLLTPPKKITEEDFAKFKELEAKMVQVVTKCGADKS